MSLLSVQGEINKMWYRSGSPREKIQQQLSKLSDVCFQFIDGFESYSSFVLFQKSIFSKYSENCFVVHFMSSYAKCMFETEHKTNINNVTDWRQSYTIKDSFCYQSEDVEKFVVPIRFQILIRVNYNKSQQMPWEFFISKIVFIENEFSWKNACDKSECSVFRKLLWKQIREKAHDLFCKMCKSDNIAWKTLVEIKLTESRFTKKPKKENIKSFENDTKSIDQFEYCLLTQIKPCSFCFKTQIKN